MSDTTRPTATAAQRVVTAMWTLDQPATAKHIAASAGLGYSTVTPILRNLHADGQATKTDTDSGVLWHLTVTETVAATAGDTTVGRADAATAAPSTDDTPADSAEAATDTAPADSGAPTAHVSAAITGPDPAITDRHNTTADPDAASADPDPGDVAADERDDGTPDGLIDSDPGPIAEPESPAADLAAPVPAAGTRSYRKPVQPRRAKGALRAAVLQVLTGEPGRAFKVGEVCKAVDAANTDGSANRAGAGAVANALDKLVNCGEAVRVAEKPATYQAA